MPRLDWIGKKSVVNHHREVPFHVLRENPELSVGDPSSGNLLVRGDNLLALKAAFEYKNQRDWHLPENIEKRRLGELWEKRSNGQCLFIMPEGKDFEAIRIKVRTAF